MTEPPTDLPQTEPVRVLHDGDDVHVEVTVAAPVAVVWEHLRDPALIARWHGWDDPGLDDEIALIYGHGAREGERPYVLETKGGAAPGSFEHGDRFELHADGDATVVRITRGPKGVDPDWDAMYDDITEGWTSFLAQLRFAVERQRGKDRRTVFLAGASAGPGARALLGLADRAVGEPVTIDDPDVTGTTWFRTGHQTGLTADAYGPGLVVAADMPSASMVIVSTFGLGDDEFAAVDRTWRTWWEAHHPS